MLYLILFPLILFPYPIHPSIKLSYVPIAATVHKTVYIVKCIFQKCCFFHSMYKTRISLQFNWVFALCLLHSHSVVPAGAPRLPWYIVWLQRCSSMDTSSPIPVFFHVFPSFFSSSFLDQIRTSVANPKAALTRIRIFSGECAGPHLHLQCININALCQCIFLVKQNRPRCLERRIANHKALHMGYLQKDFGVTFRVQYTM